MANPLVDRVKRLFAGALGRMQVGRGLRQMQLVETLNLGGKRQLMLVLCDGRRYLIGAGGDSVHSIEEVRETTGVCETEQGLHAEPECGSSRLGAGRFQ